LPVWVNISGDACVDACGNLYLNQYFHSHQIKLYSLNSTMSVFAAIRSGTAIIERWIIVLSASFEGLYLHNYYTLNVTMCKQCITLYTIFYIFCLTIWQALTGIGGFLSFSSHTVVALSSQLLDLCCVVVLCGVSAIPLESAIDEVERARTLIGSVRFLAIYPGCLNNYSVNLTSLFANYRPNLKTSGLK